MKAMRRAFNGRLHGDKRMKALVCEAVAMMPQDIIDHITSDCWFLSSTQDAWAFTLRGDELTGKHLIFLGEDLFRASKKQIMYTIAHEIGHVVLGHRNSILVKQTSSEIKRQEVQADEFAKRYIN